MTIYDEPEDFKLAYEYEPGDTQPNATAWQDDCGYDLDAGFCRLAYPDGCPTCPHWQAIGDVQS